MTKRAVHSNRLLASVVALGLVLLQLVSALHFALVPHGFAAGLSGFVHVHRAHGAVPEKPVATTAMQRAPNRPTLVAGIAACAPEACSLGFSGPTSRPLSASQLCALIFLGEESAQGPRAQVACDRVRVLLSAPKTSPPIAV